MDSLSVNRRRNPWLRLLTRGTRCSCDPGAASRYTSHCNALQELKSKGFFSGPWKERPLLPFPMKSTMVSLDSRCYLPFCLSDSFKCPRFAHAHTFVFRLTTHNFKLNYFIILENFYNRKGDNRHINIKFWVIIILKR